jgi:hypothetical protein
MMLPAWSARRIRTSDGGTSGAGDDGRRLDTDEVAPGPIMIQGDPSAWRDAALPQPLTKSAKKSSTVRRRFVSPSWNAERQNTSTTCRFFSSPCVW